MTWRPAKPEHEPARRLGESLEGVIRGLGPAASTLVTLTNRWEEVVGPALGAHTRPLRLDAGVLTLAVDDSAWATQVRYLEAGLLERLAAVVGEGQVRSTRVVVRPP